MVVDIEEQDEVWRKLKDGEEKSIELWEWGGIEGMVEKIRC